MSTTEIKAYAAYEKSNMLREASSSGGIFSLIAQNILDLGGLIYGAAYNESFSVHHISVTSNVDLELLRGAKYAQSFLGDTFSTIQMQLESGKLVLFSGTPCQVVSLKNYLRKDYDNLFCIDFVCHGVPLKTVWESYVKYRSIKDDNGNFPVKINLRSKHTGWSHYKYSNLYEYKDGKKYSALSCDDLYMKLFTGDYINMKACSNCHFKGYSRVSDITLGDFWGIWDVAPEMDDNKGTSLVMIQSEKGATLWNQIKSQTKWKEMTLEEASRQNPSILYASPAKSNREEIIKLCLDGKWEEVENMLPKPEIPTKSTILKERLKHAIKKIIGQV